MSQPDRALFLLSTLLVSFAIAAPSFASTTSTGGTTTQFIARFSAPSLVRLTTNFSECIEHSFNYNYSLGQWAYVCHASSEHPGQPDGFVSALIWEADGCPHNGYSGSPPTNCWFAVYLNGQRQTFNGNTPYACCAAYNPFANGGCAVVRRIAWDGQGQPPNNPIESSDSNRVCQYTPQRPLPTPLHTVHP